MPDIQRSAESDLLPVVDPREFLIDLSRTAEAGRLATAPDIGLLRWLPTLECEAGLVLLKSTWYVVKGNNDSISIRFMPSYADVLLHSHPSNANDNEIEESYPSPGDFLNGSSTAKNLMVSFFGIAQYWRVKDREGRWTLDAELYAFHPRSETAEGMAGYPKVLAAIGARYKIHKWAELDEQELRDLLRPGTAAHDGL